MSEKSRRVRLTFTLEGVFTGDFELYREGFPDAALFEVEIPGYYQMEADDDNDGYVFEAETIEASAEVIE